MSGLLFATNSFLDSVEDNYSLSEFLECFPSMTRPMPCQILETSESALLESAAA